ncbi:MAG: N-acetylmuramoyl-L-alanine amidase [bacterium]
MSGPLLWKNLPDVQNAIGITNYVWDGDSLCFSNDQHLIRFYQGRRKSDVNGTTLWLNATPDGSVTGGDWRIASTDLDLLLLSVLPKEEGLLKPLLVMLDPGHGGEDDGARSTDPVVKEKGLNLAMALKIGAGLTNAGLQVAYTRTNDTALALEDRSRLARKASADLFVSVHANYAANAEAAGVETYVLTPNGYPGTADGSRPRGWQIGNRNDFHNTLLGFSIHRKLSALPQTGDRGLKHQSFFVLRETSCPAVLLEFGFLSNPTEARKLLDPVWQETCATAISDGILSYAKKVDALDKAVAEKRKHDAEANERWRLHLIAQASKPSAPQPLLALSNAAPALAASRTPDASNSPCVTASCTVVATGTNAASPKLNALTDFYVTGKLE